MFAVVCCKIFFPTLRLALTGWLPYFHCKVFIYLRGCYFFFFFVLFCSVFGNKKESFIFILLLLLFFFYFFFNFFLTFKDLGKKKDIQRSCCCLKLVINAKMYFNLFTFDVSVWLTSFLLPSSEFSLNLRCSHRQPPTNSKQSGVWFGLVCLAQRSIYQMRSKRK